MKHKKNGFTFIETIITIVVLSASLLYLYNSYSSIIKDEESRLYYDDTAYIYKTNHVRKFLEASTNIDYIKKFAFTNSYIITIGPGFDSMFNEEQKNKGMDYSLENIFQSYNINQMVLIKSKMFDDCVDETLSLCKTSLENLSYNMKEYINTLNDTTYDYYLVIEYAEKLEQGLITKCNPGEDKRCISYYASLGM